MSVEKAKTFIKKIKTDEAFRNRIMAIEDVDERMKIITMGRFNCTKDDINALNTDLDHIIEAHEVKGFAWGGSCLDCSLGRYGCC